MIKINIVFDNIFDDVDIIAIPNEISSKIEVIGQEFLDWLPNATESDYWKIIDGQKYSIAETNGFINWINSHYCTEIDKAYVVTRNTNHCPEYKTIEF